jgi:protoporphyrinogen oxidase
VSATAGFDVRSNGDRSSVEWRSVTCLYFAAPRAPVADGILVLNGEGVGPVNNLCVMDQVADTYSPQGTHLVSVTVLEDHADEPGIVPLVREQLERWFGPDVGSWTHVETYRIGQALPRFGHGRIVPDAESRIRPGVYVCGDHTANPSLQAALRSGRKAAEAVIEDRAKSN